MNVLNIISFIISLGCLVAIFYLIKKCCGGLNILNFKILKIEKTIKDFEEKILNNLKEKEYCDRRNVGNVDIQQELKNIKDLLKKRKKRKIEIKSQKNKPPVLPSRRKKFNKKKEPFGGININ